MEYPKFKANIVLKGKIELLTGMHIGGSKDKLEIGGVDSPVLRNPQNRLPYIPGSSLKGKLRSLLEYSLGVVGENGNVSDNDNIVRLFGIGANDKKESGPTRLIIRDANPTKETIESWEKIDSELLYTEFKPENTINRFTSAANPRFMERVVEGSEFEFEIIYGVYQMNENDTDEVVNNDLSNLLEALRLLESSFIGGSGSRGYGKVKFKLLEPMIIKTADYRDNTEKYKAFSNELPIEDDDYNSLAETSIKYEEQ